VGQCRLPASILSLSLALRSRGSSADSSRWLGTVVRTKVHELSWEGRWTRSATGWGLRYRMDAVEHARPLDARSRLPRGGRLPCGRGAGVRCPWRGTARAHPRAPHRGPDGLQGSPSNVATSS